STCSRCARRPTPARSASRLWPPARPSSPRSAPLRSSSRPRSACRSCPTGSRQRLSWSRTAWSNATPDRRRDSEVFGQDQIRFERRREALDLVGHVGAREALEIADDRLDAEVELLLEPLELLLAVDAAAVPVAIWAVQRELPAVICGCAPLEGLDKLRLAVLAEVQPIPRRRFCAAIEAHDL